MKTFKIYFLRGMLLGLLGTSLLGSFIIFGRVDGSGGPSPVEDKQPELQKDGRKKVVAFVGVQVGN